MGGMTIRAHTGRELAAGLESNAHWKRAPYYITRARLVSQLKNPCLRDDDVVLVTAHRGETLVGYLGAIPDYIHPDAGAVRLAWASCWWVHPSVRGTGVGRELLTAAMEAYGGRFGISSCSAEAQRVLGRHGEFSPLTSRVARLSLPLMLRMGLRGALGVGRGFHVDYDTSLDAAAARFIEQVRRPNELARRSVAQLNWILSSPWKVSGAQRSLSDGDYFFSFREPFFCWSVLEVHDPGRNLVAVLILKRFSRRLEVPYAFVRHGWEDAALRALVLEAVDGGVSTLRFADDGLTSALRRYLPLRPWLGSFALSGFLSKGCGIADPGRYYLHLGDGDNAFT